MYAEENSIEADKKRFWFRLVVILIGLLLLAMAGWFGRYPYRHFTERHFQAQAQTFLAKGDYRNALLSARQTLQLNPTNVPACRVMATIADLSHSPVTLDLLLRIVQTEPTTENKLLLASAGLRYQNPPFPITTQILDALAPTATNLAGYHVVAASLDLRLRRVNEAENHFESAARLDPTNRLYELNLAVIRLSLTNETQVAQSRLVLEKFSTDAQLGPQALRSLVADRLIHQDPAAANNYSTRILAGPQASLADQLQHLAILQQLKSADFNARLQSVQQQAATNAPAAAQVAGWMQANGHLADSLHWLTNLPAGIRSESSVRLALADGYLQSADWRTLRDFSGEGSWGDAEFLRLALLSRAWAQLDVKPVADSNWGSAVGAAGNRYGALTMLLGLAEKWQLPEQREDLLARIVAKFPKEIWAQQALAKIYFTAGKTAELQQLFAKLLSISPQNAGLKNNLAFVCLLLKTNLPQAAKWAAEVYDQSPGTLDFAATYALALHLQGRDQDGLAVLQKFPPRQLESPSAALYYGLLLAATHNASATAYLQIARSNSQLLPEEQHLLADALPK
jgi:tetratricopeptide (TPR) repeat protein